MIISRRALSRRTFLRGAGAAVALPLLDAMIPAASAMAKTAANPVRRFSAIYLPNGIAMPYWTPAKVGTDFELPPILEPLAPFRTQLTVFSGLDGPGGYNHAGGCTSFLTGLPNPNYAVNDPADSANRQLKAGPSLDQLIAKEVGKSTPVSSLCITLDDANGPCDGNASCVYTNTVSWIDSSTPVLMEINPRAIFETLFGDSGTTDSKVLAVRRRRDRSLLDGVMQQVTSLAGTLGPTDRAKLDEYLAAVRDIESRIQAAEAQGEKELPAFAQPAGIPTSYAEYARLMFDLQLLALQADLTRATVIMMGREISSRGYPEVGVPDAHHAVSHHLGDPQRIATYAKVNTFHVSLFAEFLKKLQATPDGDGSLLDHMIIMYGAGMSDSNEHRHDNLPTLLVGGGAGRLKGGRHLKYNGLPNPNLLVTIADKMGVPVEKVGASNGKLEIDTLSGV